MAFKITIEQKDELSALVILYYIIQSGKVYTTNLEGNDLYIKDCLSWLVSKEYLKIVDDLYFVTVEGKEKGIALQRKCEDFIRRYDILRYVDTNTGEFAYSSIFKYETEPCPVTKKSSWDEFLDNSRWHDLRLAAAEFHKINFIEMLFVAFLVDGEFNTESQCWQRDFQTNSVFNEMEKIINNRISLAELGYSATDQIEYIIGVMQEAKDIMIWIEETENEEIENGEYEYYEEDDDYEHVNYEIVKDTYCPEDYYNFYCNPFYVSPCWSLNIFT